MSLEGKAWSSYVSRGKSLYVQIAKGDSLRLTGAELRFDKKGNVAELYVDLKPQRKDCSSNESHNPDEPEESKLGSLSFKSPITLDRTMYNDFALRQSGQFGDVIVYGEKSRKNGKINVFDFDPQSGSRILSIRNPNKFQFVEQENYEYPPDRLHQLPEEDQRKIKDQRWKMIADFISYEENEKIKDGSTS